MLTGFDCWRKKKHGCVKIIAVQPLVLRVDLYTTPLWKQLNGSDILSSGGQMNSLEKMLHTNGIGINTIESQDSAWLKSTGSLIATPITVAIRNKKTIPSFSMKQKWSTKQAFSLKTIVPIISTPRRLRGIISDTNTTLTESYGHTKINDRINCSRWSKECRAFQLVKLSEDPRSIEGWSLSV